MCCPFFHPTVAAAPHGFDHPERLPLGDAYAGECTAAKLVPNDAMLPGCNLGYANCEHLPADRAADAVRFSTRAESNGVLTIQYVCEAAYLPVAHGVLIFDRGANAWRAQHADPRIQRMAECCVEARGKQQ